MKLRELNLPMNTDDPNYIKNRNFDLFIGLYSIDVFLSLANYKGNESVANSWYQEFLEELRADYDWHIQHNRDTTFLFKGKLVTLEALKEKIFKRDKSERVYFPKPIEINDKGKITRLSAKVQLNADGDSREKLAELLYRNLNEAIDLLKTSLNENISPQIPSKTTTLKPTSFMVKNPGVLNDAFQQLVNSKFILASDEENFIDTFFGRTPKKRIEWQGDIGALSYFIKEINGEGIVDVKKQIWNITLKCFSKENGESFTKSQLRYAKKPKGTRKIDNVIDTFKEFNNY